MDPILQRWGIQPGYHDTAGTWHVTSPQTQAALLAAMGVAADDRPPEPARTKVLWPDELLMLPQCELTLEDGTRLRVEGELPPDVPYGYHRLQPQDGSPEVFLIKRPAACHLDPAMKTWGWAVQLYAARSKRSWGFGDLADLRQLARWSAQLGAGAVLVNPLSAAVPVLPQQPSPYYPSSRRFRNPLYLSLGDVPGAAESSEAFEKLADQALRLNAQRQIDRDRVYRLKMEALDLLWQRWPGDEAFEAYCREGGPALSGYGAYCVLAEQHGGDWRHWPPEYRQPGSPAVAEAAEQHRQRVRFHLWLQWLLDRQLADAARHLPLVQDLPIGVDPGGADAWLWQDVMAQGVSVGAPPDPFNAEGQDWSLPPFIPHRLRAVRFEPFIQTIRAALRHAGGLRIDHVMGLFRLFWIPASAGPQAGTYVRYPWEELLAIVAVESHRASAWIAGEDLGTVEDHVRERLRENQILSYRLMWFEEGPPREYPRLSLAAITTHDLPTVAGLWTGADFAAQDQIGLRPSREGYQQLRQRLQTATGIEESASAAEAVEQAYRAIATSPAAVLVANLDDALAVEERPNMPGTLDQWPNWSIALPQPLEEIAQAELPQRIASRLNRLGASHRSQ